MSTIPAEAQVKQDLIDQLLINSPILVFVRDRAGRYLRVSRSYCELFDKAAEEFVGLTPQQVFGQEVGQRFQGSDHRVIDANEPLEVDVDVDSRGQKRAFRTLKFPLRDETGKPYAVCGIANDITVRKRQEEALHGAALTVSRAKGESLFHELVRYLATALGVDGAFITLCEGGVSGHARTLVVYADGTFEENIEYELQGTVCGTVIGQEYRIIPARLRQLYPEDRMFKRLAMEAYAAHPLIGSQGDPLGLIAAISRRPLLDEPLTCNLLKIFAARVEAEIERHSNHEQLRISEASYRTMFEASEDAIFVHDWETGAVVDANPKACATYDCGYDEVRQINVAEVIAGVASDVSMEVMQRIDAAKAGIPQNFERPRKSRDGRLHWDEVNLKGAIISGKQRLLAFTRDATARKSAEEALRSAALAVSGVSSAHRDEVFKQLAISLSAILQMDVAFIATLKENKLLSMLAFCMDGDVAEPLEYPIDGTPCQTIIGHSYRVYPKHLQLHFPNDKDFKKMGIESYAGFPLNDAAGVPFGIISVASRANITNENLVESVLKIFAIRASAEIERRRAEEAVRISETQLRQAQKMEAIGQLTGGIAHDFNNILTSILGYLSLAGERQEAMLDDEDLARYLGEARGSAQRARELIQKMLTFSRGQRGTSNSLRIAPVIDENVAMLRATLPASVELVTQYDRDVAAVKLDPVHLGQILMNLCINARDSMSQSGIIAVRVAQRSMAQEVCASCRHVFSGEFVNLSVGDTGPGIPLQVQERMFEPFFTTKEVGKGTGMGLATVHGIVHEHGGHILVDTKKGKGAQFHVLFPALTETEGDEVEQKPLPLPRGVRPNLKGRVLVVDDERAVGSFMRDLLQSWGLDVVVEMNSLRAEEIVRARREEFDLVITDQSMPKLTGLALAERLHQQLPDLPIVLYTGYGEDITEETLKRSGVCVSLRKPVDADQLLLCLQTHLT